MEINNNLCYNQHTGLKMIPYNIISHLVETNDDIWKIIKYDTPNALYMPSLTQEEKGSLIYGGTGESSTFRLFMQESTDDSFTKENTQLRVYIDGVIPVDTMRSLVTVAFEVLTHSKLNPLDGYSTRILCITESLIQSLNGVQAVANLGDFFYNNKASRTNYSKQNLYNGKNYIGMTTYMSTWIGNVIQDRI